MYARLDDELIDHPKMAIAGDLIGGKNGVGLALGFYALAIMWANRQLTDGSLPVPQIKTWGTKFEKPLLIADALTRAGLLERNGNGYTIHDFTDHNPSAADIKRKRREDRDRKRRARADR